MYSTILTIKIKPGLLDEVWTMLKDKIHNEKMDIEGVNDVEVLMDREDNIITEIIHWDGKALALETIKENMTGEKLKEYESYIDGAPILRGYDTYVRFTKRQVAGIGVM